MGEGHPSASPQGAQFGNASVLCHMEGRVWGPQQQEPHRECKQRARVILLALGGPSSNNLEGDTLTGHSGKILQWFTKELIRACTLQWPAETGSRSLGKTAGGAPGWLSQLSV